MIHKAFDTLTDMRYLAAVAIGLMAMTTLYVAPTPQDDSAKLDARARQLIQQLKLEVLPKESGYLGIIGKSTQVATVDGRPLALQSQNYYMLTRERPIN